MWRIGKDGKEKRAGEGDDLWGGRLNVEGGSVQENGLVINKQFQFWNLDISGETPTFILNSHKLISVVVFLP